MDMDQRPAEQTAEGAENSPNGAGTLDYSCIRRHGHDGGRHEQGDNDGGDEADEFFGEFLPKAATTPGSVPNQSALSENPRGPSSEPSREPWRESVPLAEVDRFALRTAEVTLRPSAVQVTRRSPPPVNAPVARHGGVRGPVREFTAASRRNFLKEAFGQDGLSHMLTLTYPDPVPTDGRVVKAHWAKFARWLSRQGIGGVWMLEFQRRRSAPHFHVLVNGAVDVVQARAQWHRIVGSGDARHLRRGVWVKPIYDVRTLACYLAKRRQKLIPEGFVNMGKFWAPFGPRRYHPVLSVLGTWAGMALLIRAVRAMRNAQRRAEGQKKLRDGGLYGFSWYGLTPSQEAAIQRLVEWVATPTCGDAASWEEEAG